MSKHRLSTSRSPTARVESGSIPTPVHDQELEQQRRWTKALSITIDGPAGSGKSTLARLLAETLGFQYIDTGATYRALAWLALDRGIPLDDPSRLRGLAIAQPVMPGYADDRWTTRIAGIDVTDRIREPRIDEAASVVARHSEVRDVLVARQRQLSLARDSVLDGRDCGTNVRPDADLKLAIIADFDERVRRRSAQYGTAHGDGAGGTSADSAVAAGIRSRDERDAPQSGLADDAVVVDTTHSDIGGTLDRLVDTWLTRRHELLDDEVTADRTAREWIEQDIGESFRKTYRRTGWLWRRMFRLSAHGVDRVPSRNCVFIANHSSMWDPAFVIMPLGRPVRYMSKIENTKLPVYNRIGDSIGMFPVRRGAGDRVALHIAESALRRGDSLGIFPEGTRVFEGRLGKPRQGAARLALVTGVPIVPVAIFGNRYAETAMKVSVAYGAPHYFDGVRATPANVGRATEAVWHDVEELWNAMRAERWW